MTYFFSLIHQFWDILYKTSLDTYLTKVIVWIVKNGIYIYFDKFLEFWHYVLPM